MSSLLRHPRFAFAAPLGVALVMTLIAVLAGCSRSPAAGADAALGVVLPKTACSALADFDLTAIGGAGGRITAAVETTNRAGAAVCVVEGTLAPTIGFAVQLHTASWTQRYLQIGCGGLCGSLGGNVGAAEGCAPLQSSGFALAATPTSVIRTRTVASARTRSSAPTSPTAPNTSPPRQPRP